MHFTAIHRALGLDPSPLTNEMLDAAIVAGLAETHDLDWKRELPPAQGVDRTDFPKDIAALANVGGGVIVYGVTESGKKATGRHDVGDLGERHESTLRRAASSAIVPAVFGLEVLRLGERTRAVAVIVPPSVDGPHLIYRGEYFGAPLRVDADTSWMRERDIEAAYRSRLTERRNAERALHRLYQEVFETRGVGSAIEPWMICVARPRRLSASRTRLSRDETDAMWTIVERGLAYVDGQFPSPLKVVDTFNPRAGLRRQVFRAEGGSSHWDEAWVTLHDDGAVTLSGVVSHRPRPEEDVDPIFERVRAVSVEAFVADFMALVYASGEHHRLDEFEVMLGIEWRSQKRLLLETVDSFGSAFSGSSVPLAQYSKVLATVSTQTSFDAYHSAVYDLALDSVNQGGITRLRCINEPANK